ncbi:MAG: hypothetical protein CM15mV12_2900 [uncultured marine virus]|nr:MAG: hypothetical protein CM15mV12_2900 [uncultured marine virus]
MTDDQIEEFLRVMVVVQMIQQMILLTKMEVKHGEIENQLLLHLLIKYLL